MTKLSSLLRLTLVGEELFAQLEFFIRSIFADQYILIVEGFEWYH